MSDGSEFHRSDAATGKEHRNSAYFVCLACLPGGIYVFACVFLYFYIFSGLTSSLTISGLVDVREGLISQSLIL